MNKPYAPALVTYPEPQAAFDETDDDLMHDLIGCERLRKPIQSLLITYKCYLRTIESFGVDEKLLAKAVLPDLKALYEACKEQYLETL